MLVLRVRLQRVKKTKIERKLCQYTHRSIPTPVMGCAEILETKETYVGRVLETYEENGYNDSDFYAVVWDDEQTACFTSNSQPLVFTLMVTEQKLMQLLKLLPRQLLNANQGSWSLLFKQTRKLQRRCKGQDG